MKPMIASCFILFLLLAGCGQGPAEKAGAELDQRVQQAREEVSALQNQIKENQQQIEQARKDIAELNQELQGARQELSQARENRQEALRDLQPPPSGQAPTEAPAAR